MGAQYGDGTGDQGCGGSQALSLGAGERVTLPSELTRHLFDDPDLAHAPVGAAGGHSRCHSHEGRAGVSGRGHGQVTTPEKTLRMIKHVLISEHSPANKNPRRRTSRCKRELVTSDLAALSCTAADGGGLHVAPSAVYGLRRSSRAVARTRVGSRATR
jgi:hypothetical protein